MPRHSKNNTARGYHTRHEYQQAGYGTQKTRLGNDAQVPFGYCGLCLALSVDPVASPAGDVYCRECIYKYLLDQKQKLKRARKKYEEQLAELAEEATASQQAEEDRKLQEFIAANTDTASADVFRAKGALETLGDRETNQRLQKLEEESKVKEAISQLSRKFISRAEVNTKEELKRTSFWMPEHAPEAAAQKIPKPDKAPRDPLHPGRFLRLKQLTKVNFRTEHGASAGASSKKGMYLCAVTKKPITHQKAILLRPSGEVMMASCLKTLVEPTMRCPITSKKLKKNDIIHLAAGGTSFSAHNKVIATKYTPTM